MLKNFLKYLVIFYKWKNRMIEAQFFKGFDNNYKVILWLNKQDYSYSILHFITFMLTIVT